MPRFAVLQHDRPVLHWDFLLEHEGVLLTWRLSAPPQAGAAVDGEKSFDHRLVYLDHEGPVGGGRGSVTRWDGGTFDWEIREANRVVVPWRDCGCTACSGSSAGKAGLARLVHGGQGANCFGQGGETPPF